MSRIALMLPDLRPGGAERVFVILAREFADRGHEVSFVLRAARGELLDEARALGRVHDLRAARVRHAPLALARHLRADRPDALLVGMWPLTGAAMLGIRLAGTGTPAVLSEHTDFRHTPAIHGLHRRALPRIMPAATAGAAAITAVSEGVRDSLVAAAGLAPGRIEVIHNPVRRLPATVPPPDDADALAGWMEAGTRLIAIGTLKAHKAFDRAIEAMARLAPDLDAHLLILGEGAERAALEARAAELGVAARVHLPGYRPDPARYLARAHLFVLSSLHEGFGNVILDALQMGVPVVATDCPSGPAEILEGGALGTLVAVGDAGALADGIAAELARDRDPAVLRARAADFAPDRVAGRYLDLLTGGVP